MKRYNCTSSDKRGAFGLCMEEHKEGAFVPFSEVGPLKQRINQLLEERNSSGLAISNAILVGVVPDKHPLRSRLELLANHRKMLIEKSELCDDLLDLIERMVNCMGLAGEEPEKDSYNPMKAWMYDAIVTMAGQQPKQSVTITETIRTTPERIWLQVGDQSHYHSEPFPEHHDEVSWCADSVVACEVPYVRSDLVGKQPDAWLPIETAPRDGRTGIAIEGIFGRVVRDQCSCGELDCPRRTIRTDKKRPFYPDDGLPDGLDPQNYSEHGSSVFRCRKCGEPVDETVPSAKYGVTA